jgi:hypothetical protein
MRISKLPALVAVCTALHPLGSAPLAAQSAPAPEVALRVTDLTPRFLRFYDAAVEESADADRRWVLWKEHYGFAALPPVPERDSLARGLLDAAWPRYPEVIDRIRAGVAGMDPAPEPVLRQVAELLELDQPIEVDLLAYVGAREKNAFFMTAQGRPTVAIPVEEDAEWRTTTLAHEFTHAVHNRLAGLSGGWERTIAETLFSEGLADRVEEALFPGRGAAAYVEHQPGWLAGAEARRAEILAGIVPHLRASDSETVMRFTMGTGATGTRREAYYAGWIAVGRLLEDGWTFARLARVPEADLPALVEDVLRDIIADAHPSRAP